LLLLLSGLAPSLFLPAATPAVAAAVDAQDMFHEHGAHGTYQASVFGGISLHHTHRAPAFSP
jgi:hypothetical protein